MLNRPLPILDVESKPFWDGCSRERLLIQKCGDIYQFPPTSYCAHCHTATLEWVEASGRGTVFSWIVVHVGIPRETYGEQVPYVTALITLDEGPRICANLVGIAPADITDGLEVEVFFEPITDGSVMVPFFRPVKK
jgi:uncharacterized protein